VRPALALDGGVMQDVMDHCDDGDAPYDPTAAAAAAQCEAGHNARRRALEAGASAAEVAMEMEAAQEAAAAALPRGSPLRLGLDERAVIRTGASPSVWVDAVVIRLWPDALTAYLVQRLSGDHQPVRILRDTEHRIKRAPPAQAVGRSYAPPHGRVPLGALVPPNVFLNTPRSALEYVSSKVSDGSLVRTRLERGELPPRKRVCFGIAFPAASAIRPLFFAVDRTKTMRSLLAVVEGHAQLLAGTTNETHSQGYAMGSPQRLNIFTVDGRMQRLDLDIEALLRPGYLEDGDVLLLEVGNFLPQDRIDAMRGLVTIAPEDV